MSRSVDDSRAPAGESADLADFGFELPDAEWLARLRATRPIVSLGRMGPFELLDEIGRGAQGVVFRARQPNTRRTIALKRLAAGAFATSAMRARFEREMEAAVALQHPNIVTVYGMEVVDGQPLLGMEWIDGRPIDHYVAQVLGCTGIAAQSASSSQPGVEPVLRLFLKVCDAVQHAHQRGVIHRDLKPSNILVDAQGEPHILDFGLAKRLIEPNDLGANLTRTDGLVGTPAYASPEQINGNNDAVGVCSDVYALGVILYQLLTGRLPFADQRGLVALLDAIRSSEPTRPSTWRPALTGDVEAIVLAAMSRDPADRYQSVHALAADIRRFLNDEPILVRADRRWYVLRKLVRRHRVGFAVAAVFVLMVSGFTVALGIQYARQSRMLDDVRAARDESERVQSVLQHLLLAVSEIGKASELDTRRELLQQASQTAEAELRDSPAAWASAQDAIGRTYQQLGLYDDAEYWLREALRLRTDLHGRRHLAVATSLDHLGELLQDRSRVAEAEPHFREALALRQELLGNDHPLTAESLYSLGRVLQNRGEYAAAVDIHRQALDIQIRLLGPTHLDVARSKTGVGLALANQGKYSAAEPYLRDALDLHRVRLGDDHREVAASRVNLGKLYFQQGRLDEAEQLLRDGLTSFQKSLGPHHDNTAWAAHRLGVVLHAKGDLAEAERLMVESIAAYRRALGDDDPFVAYVSESLASVLVDRGRVAEASERLGDAERILSGITPQHPALPRIRDRLRTLNVEPASHPNKQQELGGK